MTVLHTERLTLRSLSLKDSQRIEELASDHEVAKSTSNIPHPYPEGEGKTFILGSMQSEKSGNMALLGIIEQKTGKVIGLMSLMLSPEHKRGELGYFLGRKYWGKGYGSEAAKVMLTHGFNTLGLNRVYAAAFEDNPASWRVMEKIGLQYEGTFKEHIFRDGIYHNVVYYGLVAK